MKKIVWFARGGDIMKCGPFKTQMEATQAMKLDISKCKNITEGVILFPENMFVWPEVA